MVSAEYTVEGTPRCTVFTASSHFQADGSGSEDEDFSAFKTPGGTETFLKTAGTVCTPGIFASAHILHRVQGMSPNEVSMAEEGVSGIVLCGYLYKVVL